MAPTQQVPRITSVTDLDSSQARWVGLKKLDYIDQTGKSRTWEVAVRKTTSASGVDAVAIGNILLHPTKPASTIVVIQYRPPVGKYTIEWPAGLIDAGETAEQAAIREMKEETGYEGKVIDVGPVVSADPGLTSATLQLVMMEAAAMPEQSLDDGEHIERVVVPLDQLYERLLDWSAKDEYIVAGKLFYFAAGP
ncbi:hypothetical protein DV738_g4124, partial [Chaetothyriales sp. CBS 135597]